VIFGIIGTVLTILTIVVMVVHSSRANAAGKGFSPSFNKLPLMPSYPEEEDTEQGQPLQHRRRPSLLQIIIRIINFVLNPEAHGVIRRHTAAITNFCNSVRSSVGRVETNFGGGLSIRSRVFDFLFRRSNPRTAAGNAAVEHELENVSPTGIREDLA